MSLLALFVVGVALVANASAASFCCTPERYSAKTLVKTYREGSFFQGKGEVFYDFAAGMHAAFINITVDEFKGIFSLVSTHYDVNTNTVYTMTGGVCTKEKLDQSWLKETDQPHCIPKTATFDSTFDVGGPKESIELERYLQNIKTGQRQIVVTKHHCYPVQELYYILKKTTHGLRVADSTMVTIADLKLSIDDPEVLSLPKMCENALMYSQRNNDKNLPVDPWKMVPLLANL